MEKQPDQKRGGLFDNDELDKAIANVDDTGMVTTEQQIVEGLEIEHLPREEDRPEP